MLEYRSFLTTLMSDHAERPPTEQLLGTALDLLPISIVIVGADGIIIHANAAAAAMLSARDPIGCRRGTLYCDSPATTKALAAAIDLTTREDGAVGAEIPLSCRDGRVAIVHARQLGCAVFRQTSRTSKSVALFITEPQRRPSPPLAALTRLFNLTPAELRVVAQIASGKNRKATATFLGLADSTIKTHLDHIFLKTATSDQTELSRLVERLSWPPRPKES